jgi:hypothetical protein
MTEPTKERPLEDRAMQSTFYRKQIRLVLRHGRTVEGNIHVTEGQSLTISLAARRFLVNLTEVHWRDAADEIEHIAIRVDQILWAAPIHSSIAVTHGLPPVDHARRAELGFDDGTVIEVALYIAQEQRLTDYIDTACRRTFFLWTVSGRPPPAVTAMLTMRGTALPSCSSCWTT